MDWHILYRNGCSMPILWMNLHNCFTKLLLSLLKEIYQFSTKQIHFMISHYFFLSTLLSRKFVDCIKTFIMVRPCFTTLTFHTISWWHIFTPCFEHNLSFGANYPSPPLFQKGHKPSTGVRWPHIKPCIQNRQKHYTCLCSRTSFFNLELDWDLCPPKILNLRTTP